MAWVARLPFFVILLGIGSVAMLVPALVGGALRDYETARPFLYGGVLFFVLTLGLALITSTYKPAKGPRQHLAALFAAFTLLPVVLAVPFAEAVPDTRFINVYFEMVSSLTTTGASLFDPDRLPIAVHVWRALVAWMGGLLIWITAFAILAPMTLGGFEVTSEQEAGSGASEFAVGDHADPGERLWRYTARLAPIYLSLTAVLWLILIMCGEPPAVGLIHALSTLSTSGITAGASMGETEGGIAAEIAVFFFLFFAITRRSFLGGISAPMWGALRKDRELRIALMFLTVVPAFLFLRHWLAAIEVDEQIGAPALQALWGFVFMVLSFLTTTGFESASWDEAQNWSGLSTPGLLLAGIAVFGGGVATTAGGVKLLRVYALYKHGVREVERLVHPSSVGGAGLLARRIRKEGATIAWVFFMLFALSIAVVMASLALTGLSFEKTAILSIAALSTTGPVATIATEAPISYADLPDAAKMILAGAMVVGRLETLVIIALFNPGFWRG